MPSAVVQDPKGTSSVERRRKVRKGTFSCWECKRRKRRCEIDADTLSACTWCQRRGLDCVGQDRDDTSSFTDVEGRLDRVEFLVSRYVQQRCVGRRRSSSRAQLEDSRERALPFLIVSPDSLLPLAEARKVRCQELGGYLYSVLPKMEIINNITTRGRSVFRQHLGMHDDSMTFLEGPFFKPSQLLWAARKLFQLALCLRQMQFTEHQDVDLEVGDSPDELADRYVTAASYVTGQDFLIQSVDGLETLMMQAYCRIYTGDAAGMRPLLHCALTNGQQLGIDKATDASNENRWFRLVYAERFLSLALGSKAFAADGDIASDRLLATSQVTRRLERIHVLIAGRIITRNINLQQREVNIRDHVQEASIVQAPLDLSGERSQIVDRSLYSETQDLDRQLKQAAKCVPITWWQTLCLGSTNDDALMGHISQMLAQLHHCYLLVLVHQPYIVDYRGLRLRCDADYSKQVAMNASREVLVRFALFKNVTYVPCVRASIECNHSLRRLDSFIGMGQKALAASITILLLHIASHQLGTQANTLEHHRPQDLCLIEQNVDVLEAIISSASTDSGYGDIGVLKRLVEIEAEAAFGMRYVTWMENRDRMSAEHVYGVVEPTLKIPLPYHGHVCIARTDTDMFHTISGIA